MPAPDRSPKPPQSRVLGFVFDLLLANPRRTVGILVCLVLSGLAEGVGIAMVLPLLSFATGAAASDSQLAEATRAAFALLSLTPSLGTVLAVLVSGILLKAALVLLASRQVGYAVAQVATDLRLEVMRSVIGAQWLHFVQRPIGTFVNAITTESQHSGHLFAASVRMCAATVQALVYVGLAMLVSWTVTLAALAVGLVMFVLLRSLVSIGRRAGEAQSKHFERMVILLTDTLAGMKPVKAMGREHRFLPLVEREAQRLNAAVRRLVLSGEALRSFQEPIMVVFLALGLYVALGPLQFAGDSIIVMALFFHRSVMRLGEVQMAYNAVSGGYRFYVEICRKIDEAKAARERLSGKPAPKYSLCIELRDVTFSYGGEAVLSGANMEIVFGRVTTLTGQSGSGKTTTADLIVGLLRAEAGEILIDGEPLAGLDLQTWRRQIGYVPQELTLLHDTVFANVTLADPDLTRDDAMRALRSAGAWDFVVSMPLGMDTVVGERGMRMSGGQRQRIAIARALVARPRLLVLDESTAALDPATEAEICKTLRELAGETTVLAISHQPALVEMADCVYRFSAGSVRMTHPTVA